MQSRRLRILALAAFAGAWAGSGLHLHPHPGADCAHEEDDCNTESPHLACGGCDEEDGHHRHHRPKDHDETRCPVCSSVLSVATHALERHSLDLAESAAPCSVDISISGSTLCVLLPARGPPRI
jgi:hypothetical protein